MIRYYYHQRKAAERAGFVRVAINRGDQDPTCDELDAAYIMQQAIMAGDPSIELVPSDEYPGCVLVFWKSSEWYGGHAW